ncbi:MAG: hypothetical protein JNK73_13980 [Bacteroidia bacterium]|nr:hypothetical protein [Bacteroidia bacterium]
MTLTIQTEKLLDKVRAYSFRSNGDSNEREFGHLITDNFPNIEMFWKHFVTPLTNRINENVALEIDKTYPRAAIDNSIKDLAAIHYSVYLNLIYAADCLTFNRTSAFENFYTNLGSVCDLTEEFFTQIYFLKLECTNSKSEVVEYLSKTKFMKIAGDWYDTYYKTTYTYYLQRGKHHAPKFISRVNILDEYFGKDKGWKEFKTYMSQIRQYRNVIVHNSQIGSILHDRKRYVPKKDKIGDYKKWHEVFATKNDRFKHDFVNVEDLMNNDFIEIKKRLNDLWSKPQDEFFKLFYTDKNNLLLNKYSLRLE